MRTRVTALALALGLLFITPLNVAAAKDKDDEGLLVPVSGTFTDQFSGVGKFAGTLTIRRFAVADNEIRAVGTIRGTLTDSRGNVVGTGLQLVSLPVRVAAGEAPPTPTAHKSAGGAVTFRKASFGPSERPQPDTGAAAASTAAAAPAQLSCQILRLSIGAIDLNLLGLRVQLNPVLLVVSAVPGAGNLLGNLLCAIVGLLDGAGTLIQIVNLLNQLLALLALLG